MPLDDLEQDQVYAMFETFDVKKASCYVDEEREFLLGVIQTGVISAASTPSSAQHSPTS